MQLREKFRRPLRVAFLGAVLGIAAPQALGAIISFTASLDGAQEVPPSASAGAGLATLQLNDVGLTLQVNLAFSGLTGTTTAAHIHCCATPGINAGVMINFTPVPFPTGVTSGNFSHSFDVTAEQAANIGSGLSYVNIHTSLFPGGEIRGQIGRVPEPGTLALLSLGLAGLAATRRRKQ